MTADPMVERISSVRAVTARVLVSLGVLLLLLAAHIILAQAGLMKFSPPSILFACGAIGGFVSIQRRMKQLDDVDLQLMRMSWIYTTLAPLVGGVLALVLYMLFLSGLVKGDLFPNFVPDGRAVSGFGAIFAQNGKGFEDHAKLLFWAFVAGYSEQFVTDIIGSFEKKTE